MQRSARASTLGHRRHRLGLLISSSCDSSRGAPSSWSAKSGVVSLEVALRCERVDAALREGGWGLVESAIVEAMVVVSRSGIKYLVRVF